MTESDHPTPVDQPPATPPAHGGARGRALVRVEPVDFRVTEIMTVEPDGEGEHLWLEINKTNWNTEDVAMWLARQAGIHRLAVGYSGLKDRRAVTRQWFSLHLPGKPDPDFDAAEGLRIHRSVRHRRKLNRGTHRGNRFTIVLRDVHDEAGALPALLTAIGRDGVPNYFGEQRFGRQGANWSRGRAWLLGGEAPRKRTLKNFWLSAVRAGLFNAVLAERVRTGCWNRALDGDVLQPDRSRGLFPAGRDPDAARRVAGGEVHPTAPLPGREGIATSADCRALEQRILSPHQPVIVALAGQGLDAARRATRLAVEGLQWTQEQDRLILDFQLATGAFATSVLAELVITSTPPHQ